MREVKFRGLNANGTMVYGFLHPDSPNSTVYYSDYSQRICWYEGAKHCNQPVKNGTVGQYIGLNDQNRVDVYEGDIVVIHHKHPGWNGSESKWLIVIELTSWGYAFGWEHISGYDCSTHVMEDDPPNYEVIGNKWMNPELLEVNRNA